MSKLLDRVALTIVGLVLVLGSACMIIYLALGIWIFVGESWVALFRFGAFFCVIGIIGWAAWRVGNMVDD